jgi:serine/threonine protein phosphatase 1
MRTLIIGDIHGCSTAFDAVLRAAALAVEDQIITLGDYVDRGPDSRGVLDRLIALHARGNLVPLLGNHELMMLDARLGGDRLRMWLFCGGDETLASYEIAVPTPGAMDAIPKSHWRFLETDCVETHETRSHLFVHANACPDLPLEDQPDYMLFWEKLDGSIDHFSGKMLVCGHTQQPDHLPRRLGRTICLDTGAYEPDGWLTCLEAETGRYWQANQHGQVRCGWLESED